MNKSYIRLSYKVFLKWKTKISVKNKQMWVMYGDINPSQTTKYNLDESDPFWKCLSKYVSSQIKDIV